MFSNRINAALFLLTTALCTGTAMAQPIQGPVNLVAKDSFTLTPVNKPTQPVDVLLEGGGSWKVTAGSAENAAKLSWLVDARCTTRLKSLSVKHAAGTHNFKDSLIPPTKNLQKELSLPTFSSQFIGQLCLDIANKTFVTAKGDPVKIHDLKILQGKFDLGAAVAWVNGELLLSGQCTSLDGMKTMTNVVDKKFPAAIQIRCSGA